MKQRLLKKIIISTCLAMVSLAGVAANYEWRMDADAAQYKQSDYRDHVKTVHNVTREQAIAIANSDPSITYFFFMKGPTMVLEDSTKTPTTYRVFHHGDAVFFAGNALWWGSAPGYADGYVKVPATSTPVPTPSPAAVPAPVASPSPTVAPTQNTTVNIVIKTPESVSAAPTTTPEYQLQSTGSFFTPFAVVPK